jgi:hypothetical protein
MFWSGKFGSHCARRVDSKDMGSGYLSGDPRHYPKQLSVDAMEHGPERQSAVQIGGERHASMLNCVHILAQIGRGL